MLSFLYVYSDHSILECYNLFSGVELSMRSFFVISVKFWEIKEDVQRVISASLTVLEIFAWIVDLSLTLAIKSFQKLVLLKQ